MGKDLGRVGVCLFRDALLAEEDKNLQSGYPEVD
jgi:hypothetical protein